MQYFLTIPVNTILKDPKEHQARYNNPKTVKKIRGGYSAAGQKLNAKEVYILLMENGICCKIT